MSAATLNTMTSEHAVEVPVLLAVSYLRVSTREQAERGGTEEGFSIPAQREANARKADELGARVVREFVDAGESARSADRDGLQEMLAFIAANPGCRAARGPTAAACRSAKFVWIARCRANMASQFFSISALRSVTWFLIEANPPLVPPISS